MTSTNTFTGMDQGSRNSSRVLAPPGGGSSNIFGDSAPAPAKQPPKPRPAVQQDNILGQPQAQPAARNVQAAPKQAFNPITGEPYGAPPAKTGAAETRVESKDEKETETSNGSGKDETQVRPAPAANNAPKEHTSTRVLNPPGGRSTKLW